MKCHTRISVRLFALKQSLGTNVKNKPIEYLHIVIPEMRLYHIAGFIIPEKAFR